MKTPVRIARGIIKKYKKSIKMKLLNCISSLFNKKTETKSRRPLTDDQFNELKSKKQKKMDSILDKISKNGYDSLSNHEKIFLNNYID